MDYFICKYLNKKNQQPSTVTDEEWIYESKNFYDPNIKYYKYKPNEKYDTINTELTRIYGENEKPKILILGKGIGRWEMYCEKKKLDRLWDIMVRNYRNNKFPGVEFIKCSTSSEQCYSDKNEGVIMIYCYDDFNNSCIFDSVEEVIYNVVNIIEYTGTPFLGYILEDDEKLLGFIVKGGRRFYKIFENELYFYEIYSGNKRAFLLHCLSKISADKYSDKILYNFYTIPGDINTYSGELDSETEEDDYLKTETYLDLDTDEYLSDVRNYSNCKNIGGTKHGYKFSFRHWKKGCGYKKKI